MHAKFKLYAQPVLCLSGDAGDWTPFLMGFSKFLMGVLTPHTLRRSNTFLLCSAHKKDILRMKENFPSCQKPYLFTVSSYLMLGSHFFLPDFWRWTSMEISRWLGYLRWRCEKNYFRGKWYKIIYVWESFEEISTYFCYILFVLFFILWNKLLSTSLFLSVLVYCLDVG